MKNKKQVFAALFVTALLSLLLAKSFNENKSMTMALFTSEIEAQARSEGIIDWWNRNDYDCVEVPCVIPTIVGTVAVFSGKGKGSVPHTWCCITCEDILNLHV